MKRPWSLKGERDVEWSQARRGWRHVTESRNKTWQDARVVAVEPVADRILRIELAVTHPCKVRPGEHIDLFLPLGRGHEVRSYSIVEASEDGTKIWISVFKTPHSRGGSEYMHSLEPGDVLRVTQPLQDFPLRVGAPQYVLVAGGIGITALLGMAHVLKQVKANYTFVFVGRSRQAMAYLQRLQDEHGQHLKVHVDDEGTSLDVAELVDSMSPGTELYMCGPIRLMDAIRRRWSERDLDITDLRFETFGSSGWFDPEPFSVTIDRLGVTTTVQPHESMLEALEREGVEMMYDCRKGECGLCTVDVIHTEGEVDHRDVFHSEQQKAAKPVRKLCSCVSRVASGESGQGSIPHININVS